VGRGFPRTFRAAEWIQSDEGPMTDRAARAFLGLLAAESDTLIAANHGPETAREASERAGALLGGDRSTSGNIDATAVHDADRDAAEELAAAFVDEGSTPERPPTSPVRRCTSPPPAWDGGIAVSDESTASGPDGWPVALRGVTESIVTTFGPNDRWNVAALGLHAPDNPNDPVTARTYGRTRTWRNFTERGGGVVQFTTDPRTFVDAALTVREVDEPVLPTADAWVEVTVEEIASETEGGTTVRTWALDPVEHAVVRERVPTINRGSERSSTRRWPPRGWTCRDSTAELLDRLRYFADVVERCGGPAEREAFTRIGEATGWRERAGNDEG